jgi:hypothetical protein
VARLFDRNAKRTSLDRSLAKTTFGAVSLFAFRIDLAQSLRIRRNPFSISMGLFFRPKTSRAASAFSRTFCFGSGGVATPHQFHHPQRHNATTPLASAASIIKEVNIRASDRRGLKRATRYI